MKAPSKPTHTHLLDEARDAARAFQALNACYRVGKGPSEALFKRLDKARAALARWDAEAAASSEPPATPIDEGSTPPRS